MKIIKKIILLLIILVIGMGIAACKDEKTERSSFTNDVLAENGRSDYKIVLPETQTEEIKIAAEELRYFVEKSTGASLPVITDNGLSYNKDAKYLSIGNTKIASSAGISFDENELGGDGYRVVTKGKSVIMIGGSKDGNIYAVYDFLEYNLGVKFYTADEVKCPEYNKVNLYAFDLKVKPTFDLRSLGIFNQNYDAQMRRRLRTQIRDEGWIYTSHSHFTILPPSKYKADHPDWYSKDGTQLCMTNDEMRAEFTKNLIELIESRPDASRCMLGMEDSNTFCDCSKCSEEVKLYKESGTQMRFVNKVAADVQAWLDENQPDREFTLFTYAYFKTTTAPVKNENGVYTELDESVLPAENVGVMIAPLAYSYTTSLDDPEGNAGIRATIEGWKAIYNKVNNPYIYFYLYGINFGEYLVPFGDWSSLKENYLMCQEAESIGIFHLHAYNVQSSAFMEMRSYVASQLMWDVNQSPDDLVRDFMENYYKVAAPKIYEYYEMMRMRYAVIEEEMGYKAMPSFGNLDPVNKEIWPRNFLEKALELLDQAQAEVDKLKDTDPEMYKTLSDRVLKETISVRYLILRLYNTSMTVQDLLAEIDSFEADCAYFGIAEVREHVRFGPVLSEYIEMWRQDALSRV